MKVPKFRILRYVRTRADGTSARPYFRIFVPGRLSGGGKGRWLYFSTRAAAEKGQAELVLEYREKLDGLDFDLDQRRDALRALENLRLAGVDGKLSEIVAELMPVITRSRVGLKVADFFERYESAKAETWRARTLKNWKLAARAFLEDFGARGVETLTDSALVEWLKVRYAGKTARAGIIRTLRGAWGWGQKVKLCAANPWPAVALMMAGELARANPEKEIDIFTPAEASALMMAARVENCVAAFAVLLFAGVRPVELERLKWSDIFDGYIHLRASVAKTKSARVVRINSTLAAWLDFAERLGEKKREKIIPKNWKRKAAATRKTARAEDRQDTARHSFASYRLAAGAGIDEVKLELGHSRGSETLFAHYRGLTTAETAARYWSIMPPELRPVEYGGAAGL